jgi:hypothetical protein
MAPFYPYSVKWLAGLIPGGSHNQVFIFVLGVIFSNICFLGVLWLLFRMVVEIFHDLGLARRSVWYLALFPTSFFFSAFYSESLYLLLVLAAFYSGWRQKWWLAGMIGFLIALTRPVGFIIFFPLLYLYWQKQWCPQRLNFSVIWLFLVWVGFIVFLNIGYQLTGNFFISAERYIRYLHLPWDTLWRPLIAGGYTYLPSLEISFMILFLFLTVGSFFVWPSAAFGIYGVLALALNLFSGTLMSTLRYHLILFPAVVVLARLGAKKWVHYAVLAGFFILQIILMALWSRFYWVG